MTCLTISVVIPVYNGERFIQRCLDSIYSQTRPADEIIVVNDGSTDRTEEILRLNADRIRIIRQPNRGRSTARNVGIDATPCDYMAFLDADDEFLPCHLQQLADAAIKSRPDILYDWIGEPYFRANDLIPRKPEGRRAYRHLSTYQLPIQCSMVYRCFLKQHGIAFDTDIRIGEDALFFCKLIAKGAKVKFVRATGTRIGRHDANTTLSPLETTRQSLPVYDRLGLFLEGTGIDHLRTLQRETRKGRNSAVFKIDLYRLYESRGHIERPLLYAMAKNLFFVRPLRWVDRARCILALLWASCRLFHNRRYERMTFGYGAAGTYWL